MKKNVTLLKTWSGKGFPKKFWEYNLNPITGYSESNREECVKKELGKYYQKVEYL